MRKKTYLVMAVFLVAVLLIGFASAQFTRSNPQLFNPGANSFSYLGSQGVNAVPSAFTSNQCSIGSDFLVQVAPFGCTPSVVRSDLLEEQNVPVFCQLYATKLNPLIDVNSIESISFTGTYPEPIAGIGFHPARAAVNPTRGTLINSPLLENIGYVTIVLKQNKNESSMPDSVSGNLTARLRYDVENAFGVGKASFYLPVLDDNEWNDKFGQYGFWNKKAFLRSEGIQRDTVSVSVYSDASNKLYTTTLGKGETSGQVYLPGLYCRAGTRIRLDEVVNPDTRVRLNVNGDIFELSRGERFLENKCSVGPINSRGFFETVSVVCRDDSGTKQLNLQVNPKIKLKINDEVNEFKIGDRVFQNTEKTKSVYLAYADTKTNPGDVNGVYVYLLESNIHSEKLDENNLNRAAILAKQINPRRITGSGLVDGLIGGLNIYAGLANQLEQFVLEGRRYYFLSFGQNVEIDNKVISIEGFSDPVDMEISDENIKKNFENAKEDYETIIQSFPNEKENQNSLESFGKRALQNLIELAFKTGQKRTTLDLCKKFEENYEEFKADVSAYCDDLAKISSSDYSTGNVLINGKLKEISFEGVYEPSLDDFSAEIQIKFPDGNLRTTILGKNEVYYLSTSAGSTQFSVSDSSFLTDRIGKISLRYNEGKSVWEWSDSLRNDWVSVVNKKLNTKSDVPVAETPTDKLLGLLEELEGKNFETGKSIITNSIYNGESAAVGGSEFIQLIDLDENAARVRVNFNNPTFFQKVISDTVTLRQGTGETFNNAYTLTLVNVNLKKFAKVSVLPNVENRFSEANLSFNIGIEKRNVQLTPDKIRERIDTLNKSIDRWEGIGNRLGKAVRFGNTACLATGTYLTIQNFFENIDGKAIARQEVMRSAGGWYDQCKSEIVRTGESLDSCLSRHSDEIEKDVESVAGIIENQNAVTEDNVGTELENIRNEIGDSITLKGTGSEKENTYDFSSGSNLAVAFSQEGYSEGIIGLGQARDIQRLLEVYKNSEQGTTLHTLAETRLNSLLKNIETSSQNLALSSSTQEQVGGIGIGINIHPGNENSIPGQYNGKNLLANQISGITLGSEGLASGSAYPATIAIVGSQRFLVLLDGEGSRYNIRSFENPNGEIDFNIYNYAGVSGNNVKVTQASKQDKDLVRGLYPYFVLSGNYENRYTNAEVRYFETEPYKGLPALVPFDTTNGWYVGMKQTSAGFGSTASKNVRTYDSSGEIVNYYLCNVGSNGKEEFESNLGDDECRGFNAATRQAYDTFLGLTVSQTNALIGKAMNAVREASRQHSSGVTRVSISGAGTFDVGNPSVGIPDLQCQDFMSPDECLTLFNACDPVVCPASRCNFGGAFQVSDVVQSGIVGSTLLCLPNAKEGIIVPVCLSGLKAGVDSYVSVEKNYRDCLQTNLETGETVGICDEIHSIYLCDFFWNQAQPLAQTIVPRIFETITGQGARGGGEYLGVRSAWENAGNSIDYMTNYYGATSFEAFRSGVVKEVGSAVCKNFISTAYPGEYDFLDSLVEPKSPPQYNAWFEEAPFTKATVPPISRYKVFYHIFAGQQTAEQPGGTYYSVYLKNPKDTSVFQINPQYQVASGFIAQGDYASETSDFTGPAGYTELCVRVNAQEECGFGKVVSSDFAIDYLQEQYIKEQATQTGEKITTEQECVAGNPSLYSLINPNVQAGVNEILNPEIYDYQIVRVCSTDNPGKGTDAQAGTKNGRWLEVGTCDGNTGKLKCYLDRQSVKEAIKFAGIEDEALGEIEGDVSQALKNQGEFINDFSAEIEKIKSLDTQGRINYINPALIAKAFFNSQKAQLYLLRGDAYRELVFKAIDVLRGNPLPAENVPFGPGTTTGPLAEITLDSLKQEAEGIIQDKGNVRISDSELRDLIDKACNPNIKILSEIECKDLKGGSFSDFRNCFTRDTTTNYFSKILNCVKDGKSPLNREGDAEQVIEVLEERGETYCTTLNECRIKAGDRIAEISKTEKDSLLPSLYGINSDNSAWDKEIQNQGIADNFQCLMIQIALQESSLEHCKDENKMLDEKNYLYCDGNANEVKTNANGENSIGVLQINIDSSANSRETARALNFEDNVIFGSNLLLRNYGKYGAKKIFFKPTGKTYSGWKAAIRAYNGLGFGGDNDYVEHVINQKTNAAQLFPGLCGKSLSGGLADTTQETSINADPVTVLDTEILYLQQNVLSACKYVSGILVSPSAVVYSACSEFKSFLGRLYQRGVLNQKEYNNILDNPDLYTLDKIQPLLERKRDALIGLQDTDDECIANANWVNNIGKNDKNLLNNEISNLNQIIRKYGDIVYVCRTPAESVDCSYSEGALELKALADRIHNAGLLTDEEYKLLITTGDEYRGRIYGAFYLKEILQKKLSSAESIDSKTISPGRVYIELDINDENSCTGYSLIVYNPEVFGNEEQKFDLFDSREINSYYYLPVDVTETRSSGLFGTGLFSTTSPNKYKFKIYNSNNEEIFEGGTITVSSTTGTI